MIRTRGPARTSVSLGISALMLFMSVAVPVLERAELANEPVVESEHDPGACPTGHDHTVCTQIGANVAAPAGQMTHRAHRTVLALSRPADAATFRPAPFSEGHPSRAPPHA